MLLQQPLIRGERAAAAAGPGFSGRRGHCGFLRTGQTGRRRRNPGRGRGRRGLLNALLPCGQVLPDPADHLGLVLNEVHVGGSGQVRVTEDRLDVPHGQRLIPAHPQRRGMAQVMHRVIGAQQHVDPLEHRPQCLVVHRLAAQPVAVVTAAQRPPQGLVRFQRIEPGQIQPDPHERLRAGREPLLRPRALPADPHELLAPVQVAAPHAEQLAGTGAGADPQREDRPVPVRPQPREQLVPPLVGHRPRRAPGNPRVIADLPLRPERSRGL